MDDLDVSCISSDSYQQITCRCQTVGLQETSSVGVEDRSDYLRGGNVKLKISRWDYLIRKKLNLYIVIQNRSLPKDIFSTEKIS